MEYAGPAPAAFDIANHFVEHVGADGVLDYRKRLPSKEFQVDWIREYLTEFNRLVIPVYFIYECYKCRLSRPSKTVKYL